jgi:hypothetical protein
MRSPFDCLIFQRPIQKPMKPKVLTLSKQEWKERQFIYKIRQFAKAQGIRLSK